MRTSTVSEGLALVDGLSLDTLDCFSPAFTFNSTHMRTELWQVNHPCGVNFLVFDCHLSSLKNSVLQVLLLREAW